MQPAKDGKATINKDWDRWLDNETEAYSDRELRACLRAWPGVFGPDDWRQPVVEEAVNLSFRKRKSGVGAFRWKAEIQDLLDGACDTADSRSEILSAAENLTKQAPTATESSHYLAGVGFCLVFARHTGQRKRVCPGLVGTRRGADGSRVITSPLVPGSFPLSVARQTPERFADFLRDVGSPSPPGLIEWFVAQGVFEKNGGRNE